MKKLFFSFCLLVAGISSQAQEADTTLPYIQTFTQRFDSLAAGLIYSRVPTGVLYDRVYPWSGIENWKPADTLTPSRLRQAAWEMTQARVTDTDAGWTAYNAWQGAMTAHKMSGTASVLALNYRYNILDSQAAKDGRIYMRADSIIADKGTGAPPYVAQTVSWAALGIDVGIELYAESPLPIAFPAVGLLDNTTNAVTAIRVRNLATGQELLLQKGGAPQMLQLPQAGAPVLEFALRYANGSFSAVIRQQITVLAPFAKSTTSPDCLPVHGLIESEKLYQGAGEPVPTSTWADYHIYYHYLYYNSPNDNQCEQILKKPIIILDGFDPQNKRNFDEIYDPLLVVKGTATNLADEMRKQGYDVVILNFPVLGENINLDGLGNKQSVPELVKTPGGTRVNRKYRDGGTDFMQRNAYALEALIKLLNNTLQANGSTEPLVIVGPSMGGLISRYALTDMEDMHSNPLYTVPTWNGSPHNCRLWVSFDSPHWGANIALGIQGTVMGFASFGNQDASDVWNQQLRCSAARQLLIEQMDGLKNLAPWRQAFMNNISTAFPQQCRRISISNGSSFGLQQPTPFAGQYSFSCKGTKSIGVLFASEMKNMPLPYNSAQIYKAHITDYQPRWWHAFGGLFGLASTFRTGDYNATVTNLNPRGSMDVVPGGKYYVYDIMKESFSKAMSDNGLYQEWHVNQRSMCFVPTISALAFKYPERDWHGMFNACDAIRSVETYFENIKVATDTNEQHVTVTPSTASWMLGQLAVPHYKIVVTGPPVRCKEVTYYIQPAPPSNASVIWSNNSTAEYAIVRSNYRSVTIKSSHDAERPGSIQAKIAYDQCESEPIYTTVQASLPAPAMYPYDFSFVPVSWISCAYKAQVNGVFSGDTYEWSTDGVNFTAGGPSFVPPGTNGFTVGPNANYPVWLRLTAGSGCGSNGVLPIHHTFNYTSHPANSPCGFPDQNPVPGTRFRVVPNPTPTDWKVEVLETPQQAFRWFLHNAQGQVIQQSETQTASFPAVFTVPGAGLPPGFYYLEIQQDGTQELLKLSKQ